MGRINLSQALGGSGNSDVIECNGGLNPGVVSTDPLGTGEVTFTLTAMSATQYSYLACSYAGSATSRDVSDTLGCLIKELIRKKVIKGTYAL